MKKTSFITLFAIMIALAVSGAEAQNKSGKSIEKQVQSAILKAPNYGVFDIIKFDIDGSTVTLTGKVYSLGTKTDAARRIKRIEGVSQVINNIENLPPSSLDDDIRRAALRTFGQRGLGRYFWPTNPDVHIIVEGGRITLEGYVYNKGDRDALNIYANGISGVFEVTNNLIVGKRVA